MRYNLTGSSLSGTPEPHREHVVHLIVDKVQDVGTWKMARVESWEPGGVDENDNRSGKRIKATG